MTPRLYVESHRPAEEQPGGPARPAWLHVGGPWDGSVSVLVEAGGVGVTAANAVADQIASTLARDNRALVNAEDRAERAEEAARRAQAACDQLRAQLRDVLTGRSLFGPALVRIVEDGACWLLDPEKQERGFGLRFDSLSDLWRTFPQLRPVQWSNGELIVEAWAMPGDDVPHEHPAHDAASPLAAEVQP